jgi:ligand-binding sensor domain-containing protein
MKKLTLFCLFISSCLIAQSIGQWKIYSDMKDVKKSVSISGKIWAISDGGAFNFKSDENSFLTLTKAEGLNSQVLSALCVDKNNKIWFGSTEGFINIYDPSTGDINRIMDLYNTGKSQRQINELVSLNDTIFAATDFGLSLINPANFSFYDSFMKMGSFPSESKVLSVYKSSLIYVVTEKGIAVQKQGAQNLSVPESWNTYTFESIPNVNSATKILKFDGEILLATNAGVYRFSNNSWIPYLLTGEKIIDMYRLNTTAYFLTQNVLFSYSGGTTTTLYENYDFKLNSVYVSNDFKIYISSENGLIELNNGTSKILYPDGPLANRFNNMAADDNGNIWLATGKDGNGVGVMMFNGSSWNYFNTSTNPELLSNDIYNVSTRGNDVYLSNWGKGLTVYSNNKFTSYNTSNTDLIGISDNAAFLTISSAQADSKGNVWIANNQTASRKQLSVLTKDNMWYHYSITGLMPTDATGQMAIDQYDTKWFVVTIGSAGLYYFNEKNTFNNTTDDFQGVINTSTSNKVLNSNDISSIVIDKRGQLWIGTSQGINVISDPSRPITTLSNKIARSVQDQSITCLAVDPLDQKWVGTKKGVFVLPPDGGIGFENIVHYTSENSPLPNDDIKSIVINPVNGIAYIGTDNGLAALTTSSIKPVESFNELFVYPNPLILDGSNTNVTIDGLIKNTSIKIIDVSGKSIRTFVTPGGRVAFWDGRDDDGNYVPSGIYILVAYDEEANSVTTAKIAVIKK